MKQDTSPTRRSTAGRLTRGLLGLAAIACASLPLTGHAQQTTTFSNTASITIPDNGYLMGPAANYGSPITVSGVGTSVLNLTVTLSNLSHDYPDDLDILLVGPAGQNVMLMSDCGGYVRVLSSAPITLTFSDAAANSLPNALIPTNPATAPDFLVSGTFKPTNYDDPYTVDSFAAPAPLVGPYGATLSAFNGTNPNGVWNLYIMDDTQGNGGLLAGGWSLSVTTSPVPEPSSLALGGCAVAVIGGVVLRRRRAAARA